MILSEYENQLNLELSESCFVMIYPPFMAGCEHLNVLDYLGLNLGKFEERKKITI